MVSRLLISFTGTFLIGFITLQIIGYSTNKYIIYLAEKKGDSDKKNIPTIKIALFVNLLLSYLFAFIITIQSFHF